MKEVNHNSEMTDYEWLTQMRLCHKCRKNKAAPNRKYCFDCLDKIRENNAKRYDPDRAKEYQKRRREIYREKKKNGICVRCNKKATHGMYCYEHYIKAHKRSAERAQNAKAERNDRGLIPTERRNKGLCLWCGEKAVNGTNVCGRHSKIFSDAGRKASKKDKVVDGIWKLKESKNSGCT